MKQHLRYSLFICFAVLATTMAEEADRSLAEWWSLAHAEALKGDDSAYLSAEDGAAAKALEQLRAGKMEFTTAVPWLVKSVGRPASYGSHFNAWIAADFKAVFALRQKLIQKMIDIPIQRKEATVEQFGEARRVIADACIGFYEAVHKASLDSTIKKAEENVQLATKELKEVKVDPKLMEEGFTLGSGQSFAGVKDPGLRAALEHKLAAYTEAHVAKQAQEYTVEIFPELTVSVAAFLKKLYSEAPAAGAEISEMLQRHGLDKSPLAEAFSSK